MAVGAFYEDCSWPCSLSDSWYAFGGAAGLANLVSKVFVPGFTSDSLRELAAKDPEKFTVAHKGGILGIEEILDMVDDHMGSFVLG